MDGIQPQLIIGYALAAVFVLGVITVLILMIRRSGVARKRRKPDALAEAEVFLAYGRKKQAFQLLEKALRDDPSRADIKTKLAELRGGTAQ